MKDFDPISEVVDEPLAITEDTIRQLAAFKTAEKFVGLPGVDNEAEKKRLSNHLNKLVDTLIADVPQNSGKLWVMKQFQVALEAIAEEDTEAREYFCVELENLMDILEIESSDGLINYYMYGDLAYMMQDLE